MATKTIDRKHFLFSAGAAFLAAVGLQSRRQRKTVSDAPAGAENSLASRLRRDERTVPCGRDSGLA